MDLPVVHLITDRRLAPDLAARADAALAGLPPGAAAIHLREKDLGGRELLALARALAAVCRARGQRLLVNDRLDVALAAGADGVHLPAAGVPPADARRLLGPGALVGVSCHSAADVARARDGGASYAFLSPIFDTPSKRAYGPPLGLEALREAARLGLPLVALGGVTPGARRRVRAAGRARASPRSAPGSRGRTRRARGAGAARRRALIPRAGRSTVAPVWTSGPAGRASGACFGASRSSRTSTRPSVAALERLAELRDTPTARWWSRRRTRATRSSSSCAAR